MAEKFRVLLSDSLAPQGLEILERDPRISFDVNAGLSPVQLAETIAPYDALVVRSATHVTREVLEHALALKIIGRAGVGVDNVDLEAAMRDGRFRARQGR